MDSDGGQATEAADFDAEATVFWNLRWAALAWRALTDLGLLALGLLACVGHTTTDLQSVNSAFAGLAVGHRPIPIAKVA